MAASRMTEEKKRLVDAVVRFQQGDEASFATIYQLTLPFAYRCIHMLVKTPAVMCHVIELTYNMVYDSIRELNRPENTKTWIGRLIVHNTIIWMKEHWENYPLVKELQGIEDQMKEERLTLKGLSLSEMKIPSQLVEDEDNQGILRDTLRSMDLAQRVLVVELFLNQMSEQAVAKELDISEDSFQYLLDGLLTTLQELYAKYEMVGDIGLKNGLVKYFYADVKKVNIPSLIQKQLDADLELEESEEDEEEGFSEISDEDLHLKKQLKEELHREIAAGLGESRRYEQQRKAAEKRNSDKMLLSQDKKSSPKSRKPAPKEDDNITKEDMEQYANSRTKEAEKNKINETLDEVIKGFGDTKAARKKLNQRRLNKNEQKKMFRILGAIILAIIMFAGLAVFYDRLSETSPSQKSDLSKEQEMEDSVSEDGIESKSDADASGETLAGRENE